MQLHWPTDEEDMEPWSWDRCRTASDPVVEDDDARIDYRDRAGRDIAILHRVVALVEAVQQGGIDVDEFSREMELLAGRAQMATVEAQAVRVEGDLEAAFARLRSMVVDAYCNFADGVNEILDAVIAHDDLALESALKVVDAAASDLALLQELTR